MSSISFYEIAIKMSIGKFELNVPLKQFYDDTINNQIEILPITEKHLSQYLKLPNYPNHKDPFDKLIIATAISQKFKLISSDKNFELYNGLLKLLK